ncbi:MAG TPA: NAD(P)/FAD-dependent oxidoreductase, partial [Gemmatimonadales bacterium]|nr:NAD(P)/FAD-dependent oxidoreductase [Gemmatimonadales bacterium]
MGSAFDAIVIGAGLNGLVASAALGRAGLRVLLLERGPATGGEARAMQFAEGFRASPLSLDAGWLPPVVARGLGLRPDLVASETSAAVLLGNGQRLAVARDVARATQAIAAHSARDAERWPGFVTKLGKIAGFLESLYQLPPPDIDTTSLSELFPLVGVARKMRGLGREDMTDLLRILPMAVQELVDDTFESEALKALIAAGGVQDIRQGPRSGGTSFVLLHHLVGATEGSIRGRPAVKQGPNVLANAIEDVARAAKVSIRTGTDVAEIVVRDDRVAGVALASGEEIGAPVVLSTLDPVSTIRKVDPVWLDPEFLHAVQKIKFRGIRATALFAMDGLPDTTGLDGVVSCTPTTVALEKAYDAAKYGENSERPHVEFSVPTLRWPDLAPAGKHVVVAHAQYVSDKSVGSDKSDGVADRITKTLEEALPGFASRVR